MLDRNAAKAAGFVLTFAIAATSVAQVHTHAPGQAIRPVQYVDKPGERELGGRMIGRAIPHAEWVASGLDEQQATAWTVVSHVLLSTYACRDYVWETDEYIFDCPQGQDENAVANQLLQSGVMEYIEPDWTVFPSACSNDPVSQWHHNANRMRSCDAWDLETGDPSVSVGICDTGILTTHEDLSQRRLEAYNAVDRLFESEGGEIGAVHPHGTMTTGCAAANGNNGIGIAGVGWNLSHRMLRVSNSSGGSAWMSDLQHAARTAVETGDRVASVSYSGVDTAGNLTTATYIKSLGGLLVWSAGNDNRDLTLGNRDADDIIVVGATDSSDNKAWFSAYGPFVDVVAPGVGVMTTSSASNSSYAAVNGTSFSCPLTAGLIATIWSANPSLTPDEVESILKQGSDDIGAPGVDDTFGYGRINAFNSLSLVAPQCPPGEIEDCNGNCFPEGWLGDGDCDSGTVTYGGNLIDLDCAALNFDGGDCVQTPASNIVWQHASGKTYVWQMLGTELIQHGSPGRVNPNDWDLAGLGDFDGDGDSDILWRHRGNGQVFLWFLDGPQRVGTGSPGSANPTDWAIAGIGDFDALASTATSTDDILWRNTVTGQTIVWLMDGAQRIGYGSPGTVPVGNWTVAEVGDFDGDSRADILWRNTASGQVYMWFINGTQRVGGASAGSANPNDWLILGVGDFDADDTTASPTDDILWTNPSTGQVVIWLMDGGQVVGYGSLGTMNPTSWVMADVGDLDGDGRADLLWRHLTEGYNTIWFMDGLTVLPTSGSAPRLNDQNWTIVGIAEQP